MGIIRTWNEPLGALNSYRRIFCDEDDAILLNR